MTVTPAGATVRGGISLAYRSGDQPGRVFREGLVQGMASATPAVVLDEGADTSRSQSEEAYLRIRPYNCPKDLTANIALDLSLDDEK